MANQYTNIKTSSNQTRFEAAVTELPERSRMTAKPRHITTFNASELTPIYCREMLPSQSIRMNLNFLIREVTMKTPVIGNLFVDFYAFFVPNRIVYDGWKEVFGEDDNAGFGNPLNDVTLPTLVDASTQASIAQSGYQFGVGTIADHYGIPTQGNIPGELLVQMNDLKYRGFYECYNEYFRDQNYQPKLTYNKSGQANWFSGSSTSIDRVLRVNKTHDYFTSVLPQPQRGAPVIIASDVPVYAAKNYNAITELANYGLTTDDFGNLTFNNTTSGSSARALVVAPSGAVGTDGGTLTINTSGYFPSGSVPFGPNNLKGQVSISVEDLRRASAVQRLQEQLGRIGSRYREYIAGFFGIEVQNPMRDVPTYLGHLRRDLETYQTAQTSASSGDSYQGDLAAFSFTKNGGQLFQNGVFTALEHGYLHVFCVVRHKNIYSSYLSRDNFRLSMMDFYQPQLANLGEQPVYTREINPFATVPASSSIETSVFGYQEAWAEYRYEPDMVSGMMRPQPDGEQSAQSLAQWTYADDFDVGLITATGNWLKSNTKDVVDRTIQVTSENTNQFYGEFVFEIDKELPMPVYSVPELE
ncbi:MAG: hypothetical protein J6C93_03275 [Clostridia bacterium]|nr:hypothetical protein [Clostridia bacterium]